MCQRVDARRQLQRATAPSVVSESPYSCVIDHATCGHIGASVTYCTQYYADTPSFCHWNQTNVINSFYGYCQINPPSFTATYGNTCDWDPSLAVNPFLCVSTDTWYLQPFPLFYQGGGSGAYDQFGMSLTCARPNTEQPVPGTPSNCSLGGQENGDPCYYASDCGRHSERCDVATATCRGSQEAALCTSSEECDLGLACIDSKCGPRVPPAGSCRYSLIVDAGDLHFQNDCVDGHVCYSSTDSGTGTCIPMQSLPTGAVVAFPSKSHVDSTTAPRNIGMVGLVMCASGLLAPIPTYPGASTFSSGECVEAFDWSGVGTLCSSDINACAGDSIPLGPRGTYTACVPNTTYTECVLAPMLPFNASAVAVAWAELMACANSSSTAATHGGPPAGRRCSTSLLFRDVTTLRMRGHSCLYYQCFPAFSRLMAALSEFSSYANEYYGRMYPACVLQLQQETSAYGASSSAKCELPARWSTAGWTCDPL